MSRTIYFDLDGVLADFDRGVWELCGFPCDIHGQDETADRRMWEAVRKVPDIYARLPLMPGAMELFTAVREVYGDRCEILTGVPKPWRGIPRAAEDKVYWAHHNLSSDLVVHTVPKEEKPNFCKGANSILIDDLTRNIENWRKCGGTGILHKSAEETLQILKDMKIL